MESGTVSREYKISQDQIDIFARASDGMGRIHIDPEYAKNTSFGGTLVHGMYLLALIEREISAYSKNRALRGSVEVAFLKPVKAGEPFFIRIEPDPDDADALAVVLDASGEKAVTGTARMAVSPSRG
jgi:acyl dehydratase